jgi:hypothetical protein
VSAPSELKSLTQLLDEQMAQLLLAHSANPGKSVQVTSQFQLGDSGPEVKMVLAIEVKE